MSLKRGIYEQVLNNILKTEISKNKDDKEAKLGYIDTSESSKVLSLYLQGLSRKALDYISRSDKERVNKQIDICNNIINSISDQLGEEEIKNFLIDDEARLLLEVLDKMNSRPNLDDKKLSIVRPNTSLIESSLFTGALNEPNIVSEIKKEIVSSDRIDMLISFIKWSGLRLIMDELEKFTRCNKLRVITTSYMGATDYEAIEALSKFPNTEIKVSLRLIDFIIESLSNYNANKVYSEEEKIMILMLHYTIWQESPLEMRLENEKTIIENLVVNMELSKEIVEILNYNKSKINFIDKKVDLGFPCPMDLHCLYTRDQILSAVGLSDFNKMEQLREGVKYIKDKNVDLLFITLNKSEKDYSPSTMYEDYAINEEYFHWQSQSTTSESSATGQRYINHKKLGSKVALFVREYKTEKGTAAPYYYLGTASYASHEGDRPMSIVWKLDELMPAFLVKKSNKLIV